MERRQFLQALGIGAAAWLQDRSYTATPLAPAPPPETDLTITSVRIVEVLPKRPLPQYDPTPGSWSTGGVEVANQVSIYPKYKPMRWLFQPDPGGVSSFWVEIGTNRGLTGLGRGGPGPDDYEGFGRLRRQIKSTRIVTGEHVYTRYGFRQLLHHKSAEIWQPDIHWCGGLTEIRRIGALASAYDIPVIPHGGGQRDAIHYVMATPNSPWAEMFMPAPGGPAVVYERYEQDNNLSRGPEGIYTRPSDEPGFGWEVDVV